MKRFFFKLSSIDVYEIEKNIILKSIDSEFEDTLQYQSAKNYESTDTIIT